MHIVDSVLPTALAKELVKDAMASHKWEESKRHPSLKDNKATTNWWAFR